MLREPITDRARGRWVNILPALGVPSKFLSGKHGPCPICRDGKDRFRFDNKEGNGTYFCSQCGAGNGVKLVMEMKGIEFKEAAKLIEEHVGSASYSKPKQGMSDEKRRDMLNGLWKQSHVVRANDAVSKYLRARVGDIDVPEVLRTVERCRYQDSKVSYHPAMIATVQDADGNSVQLHRTYLTNDGRKANVEAQRRLMPGTTPAGSAVRLMGFTDTLGVAEGIETALSAYVLHGVPVWALLNTSLMDKWTPPEGVKNIIVFADCDKGFAGQAAAYVLAKKLHRNFNVEVRAPQTIGFDWKTFF